MKIGLIRPARNVTYDLETGVGWKSTRSIFNHLGLLKFGIGNSVPPVALLVLAGLTPPEHEVVIMDEEVEALDMEGDFDLVGISLLTNTVLRGYQIAERFRARGVKVVMGGMHASVLPKEAAGHADAVVVGEAEGVWHQLLADAQAGRLKPFYRSPTYCSMRKMAPLRRDLLKKDLYLITNLLQISRGCPYRCSFCSVHAVVGRSYRCRPIREIIAEMETFSDGGAVFVDDNIVGDPEYAKRLFRAIKPLGAWWFSQGTLTLAKDDELLKLAADSGCKGILIGFESLLPLSLKKIGKLQTNQVAEYGRLIEKLHANGIRICGSFILGLDEDDPSVFPRTAEFIQRHKIDLPAVSVLTPYPGTRVYEQLRRAGRLLYEDHWLNHPETVGKVLFRPNHMTVRELAEGFRQVSRTIYSGWSIASRLSRWGSASPPTVMLPAIAYNLRKRKQAKLVPVFGTGEVTPVIAAEVVQAHE
jgi:radical SAM superfamily enzyme YgiQ (UPF0313 family)